MLFSNCATFMYRMILATVLLSTVDVTAADARAPVRTSPESPEPPGRVDQTLLSHMQWRSIGPSRGGRSVAVAGVPGNPLVYYMGGTGGGVWKTEDAGNSWQPVSDGQIKTGSVGAIAVAASDPNVVYVGMGESCVRGNFSHGDGVYKSTDAGKTWKHVGLADSRQIGRIRVHPSNADVVYVAALGHVFGPNRERGVFRSKDGGASWEKVLYVDDETGAVDLAMDRTNPRILYAGFWQVRRTPYSLVSGGPGSGLYKSVDGGDTWTSLTKGLPEGIKGRIGVSASPAAPGRVWAIVEAEKGGIFRSDDYGESWQQVNDDRQWRQRAWYYTHIYADTQHPDTVYVLNVLFGKSTDGGKTFSFIRVPHGDNHDLWIAPRDNQRMINANDGGANVSFNGGQSWSRQDNQPTAQFYHVAVDNQFPYRVYGAQQDNSTVCISSRARPGTTDFYSVGGGESGYIAPHPEDPDIVYAGSYGGFLTRYDHRTRTIRNISVWPENPMGWGAADLKYRFQWTFPILISSHDPSVLYAAGNVLFKSTNEGQSWEPVSPDLTTNDKSRQGPSGGPITHDNTSVEYYCTIFSLAESLHEPGVIWAGSDDGRVHITRDAGATWTNITPLDCPKWALINMIEPSPHEPGGAYLAVTAYKLDDFTPYIFKTTDYGATWSLITEGIERDAFVRVVREDPKRRGLLYAGTETGVYVCFSDGARWQPLQLNLPVVPVTDMVVKEDDLVVATQGRSFWILEDLTQLHQLTSDVANGALHLFEPRRAYTALGRGVDITYYLREKPDGGVKLSILDENDGVIKTFESKADADGPDESSPMRFFFPRRTQNAPADKGMNKFTWDMRYPDAKEVKGAILWGGSTRGPRCPPGRYQVRLTVGDTERTRSFEVLEDPRIETSGDDLLDRFELLLRIRDRLSEAHEAINRLREIRSQARTAAQRVKDYNGDTTVGDAAKAMAEKLDAIEEALIQSRHKSFQDPLNYPIRLNNKLASLSGVIGRGEFPPTEQAVAVFNELAAQLDEQLKKLHEIEESDVPEFNRLVSEQNVPAVFKKKEPEANNAD